jgi:hypothetical protein
MKDGAGREATFLEEFAREVWVVCPRCEGQGLVRRLDERAKASFSCSSCAATRSLGERTHGTEGFDPYFGFPLWLRLPCTGELLWAYNPQHLSWLEEFVRAGLRERQRDEQWGWQNRALQSRLPKWIKLAKNRTAVSRGLAKLRRQLQAAGLEKSKPNSPD